MSKQLLNTPSKHALSLSALADHTWNRVREAAFKTAWSPAIRLAELAVVALMQNITNGQLRVLTFSHIYTFPSPDSTASNSQPDITAELRVVNDVFWIRLCTMCDLGFAEAYMYGDVECDDLVSTFLIFLHNRHKLSGLESKLSYLFTLPQKLTSTRFLNTIGNSRSNISAHYDISNRMFSGFLSEDMTYSCAIFKDLDGDLKHGIADRGEWSGGQGLKRISTSKALPNIDANSTVESSQRATGVDEDEDELQTAQLRKLDHIIRCALIKPGQRILEIGSGWGSLAIRIATSVPNTVIDTLTLSVHQQTLARARIAALGPDVAARIRVHLLDYRALPREWESAFDRVLSVEMIEAVGQDFLEKYWEVVDWAMKSEDGVGVVQVITIPELRFDRYVQEIDFIRKWVLFPGGFLPTLTFLLQTLEKGSHGRLIVDSVSNIGPHYARTLREWRRRFLARFESVIAPALRDEYPDVMCGPNGAKEIEVFKRKWISVIVKLGSRLALWEIILSPSREKETRRTVAMYMSNRW